MQASDPADHDGRCATDPDVIRQGDGDIVGLRVHRVGERGAGHAAA